MLYFLEVALRTAICHLNFSQSTLRNYYTTSCIMDPAYSRSGFKGGWVAELQRTLSPMGVILWTELSLGPPPSVAHGWREPLSFGCLAHLRDSDQSHPPLLPPLPAPCAAGPLPTRTSRVGVNSACCSLPAGPRHCWYLAIALGESLGQ